MNTKHLWINLFLVFMVSSCKSLSPALVYEVENTVEATSTGNLPLPSLVGQQPTGFPYVPHLSALLPVEGLWLGAHVYADNVCYDIGVYSDDTFMVFSCLDGFEYPASIGVLDEYESFTVHRWLARYQGYQKPSAHGVQLFNGTGVFEAELLDVYSMDALLKALEYRAHAYISGGGMPNSVLVSINYIAEKTGVMTDDVSVLGFDSIEYSDTCLELPRNGEACFPQPTMGMLIKLISKGLLYEFHADFAGYDIRQTGAPVSAPAHEPGG